MSVCHLKIWIVTCSNVSHQTNTVHFLKSGEVDSFGNTLSLHPVLISLRKTINNRKAQSILNEDLKTLPTAFFHTLHFPLGTLQAQNALASNQPMRPWKFCKFLLGKFFSLINNTLLPYFQKSKKKLKILPGANSVAREALLPCPRLSTGLCIRIFIPPVYNKYVRKTRQRRLSGRKNFRSNFYPAQLLGYSISFGTIKIFKQIFLITTFSLWDLFKRPTPIQWWRETERIKFGILNTSCTRPTTNRSQLL